MSGRVGVAADNGHARQRRAVDGYRIPPAFLHAAASADIVRRVDGSFGYDLDSVAGRLVH